MEVGNPASRWPGAVASAFGMARSKALTLHAILNIGFTYDLSRSGGADARRAHYAALFHQRFHFT